MNIPAPSSGFASPAVTPAAPPKPVDGDAMNEHLARALHGDPAILREPPAVGSKPVISVEPASSLEATRSSGATGERLREALAAVTSHQRQLDAAIDLARSGRTFSPQELLALQARTHRFAHDLNLVSKVVEQLSGGIKKALDTQI